jgi:carboxyl-terminal processing protease
MKVLREGVADTLIKEITRDEVIISIIPNQTIFRDNIGYIKLEQFSSGAAQEFKTAFLNLYRRTKLKGMIIDLRENPGGLISSAVEISEFFLPKEIDIVRTKGRNKNEFTYKTLMNPIDTNIPLIIIINENSASASEILAGAFQDLDRALIVGTRSFGKGLVQSVDEVPYGGSIKVTTAKYYIPSGRCIQKLDYKIAKDKKGLSLHHDSVFYTRNQRPVYESSGIQPDVLVDHDTLNNYCRILEDKLAFFRFANKYTGPLDTLSIDFSVDDKLLTEFRNYTSQIGIKTDGDYYQRLIALKNDSKQHLGKNLQLKLDNLIKDFEKLGNKDFEQNKEYVRKRLNQEILMRFYSFEAVEEKFFDTDKTIQKSIELMLSEEIDRILSSPKTK